MSFGFADQSGVYRVYPHYDIVIWSQTHWRWLETKLVELGMIGGTRNYRVSL